MELNAYWYAVATAAWFGLMAFRAGRNWWAWAIGGAAFALLTTAIILGLSDAAFSPISHEATVRFRTKAHIGAVAVVGLIGWLATLPLQRWHLRYWKEKGRASQSAAPKDKVG